MILKVFSHIDDSVFYVAETLFYSAQAHFSEDGILYHIQGIS